jgi:hypothetical protein
MTFIATLEPLALALNRALVALRDEAKFNDSDDSAIITAAAFFSSMLEDAHAEVEKLAGEMEGKVG